MLMGLFGLGFLIDFVSGPVSSGFTSAAALIIFTSQVKDIFGIRSSGNTFVDMWASIIKDIHNLRLWDTVMGFSCIIILLLMRLLPNIKIGPKDEDDHLIHHKIFNKTLWLIGTARNAIIVIIGGILGFVLLNNDIDAFKVIGDVPAGLPSFQAPPFYVEAISNGTTIIQEHESFGQMLSSYGSMIIIVPLIALLENISICKAFGEFLIIFLSPNLKMLFVRL